MCRQDPAADFRGLELGSSDVHLEKLDKIRRLRHGLLEFRETERTVFVVVALAKDVFDDAKFLFAGQVFVVIEDQTVHDLTNVITTWKVI